MGLGFWQTSFTLFFSTYIVLRPRHEKIHEWKKNLFCYLFKNNLRGVFPVCNGIRDRAECKANENSAPMEDTFLWHL